MGTVFLNSCLDDNLHEKKQQNKTEDVNREQKPPTGRYSSDKSNHLLIIELYSCFWKHWNGYLYKFEFLQIYEL